MTGIDTLEAEKYWKEMNKTEVDYLKVIGFISLEQEENGQKFISILGDEEGNYETKLTKKSALWLAEQLNELAKELK